MGKPHKKLAAWRKSMALVEKLYKLTATFPRVPKEQLVARPFTFATIYSLQLVL